MQHGKMLAVEGHIARTCRACMQHGKMIAVEGHIARTCRACSAGIQLRVCTHTITSLCTSECVGTMRIKRVSMLDAFFFQGDLVHAHETRSHMVLAIEMEKIEQTVALPKPLSLPSQNDMI